MCTLRIPRVFLPLNCTTCMLFASARSVILRHLKISARTMSFGRLRKSWTLSSSISAIRNMLNTSKHASVTLAMRITISWSGCSVFSLSILHNHSLKFTKPLVIGKMSYWFICLIYVGAVQLWQFWNSMWLHGDVWNFWPLAWVSQFQFRLT